VNPFAAEDPQAVALQKTQLLSKLNPQEQVPFQINFELLRLEAEKLGLSLESQLQRLEASGDCRACIEDLERNLNLQLFLNAEGLEASLLQACLLEVQRELARIQGEAGFDAHLNLTKQASSQQASRAHQFLQEYGMTIKTLIRQFLAQADLASQQFEEHQLLHPLSSPCQPESEVPETAKRVRTSSEEGLSPTQPVVLQDKNLELTAKFQPQTEIFDTQRPPLRTSRLSTLDPGREQETSRPVIQVRQPLNAQESQASVNDIIVSMELRKFHNLLNSKQRRVNNLVAHEPTRVFPLNKVANGEAVAQGTALDFKDSAYVFTPQLFSFFKRAIKKKSLSQAFPEAQPSHSLRDRHSFFFSDPYQTLSPPQKLKANSFSVKQSLQSSRSPRKQLLGLTARD
jgi:hypothetical protein